MEPDRDQLDQEISDAWETLMGLVDRVPRERMEEPNAVDRWSVKDVLGHVFTWDAEVAREVRHVYAGGSPFARPDDFNDSKAAELRELPLSETLARLASTHDQTVAYLATLPAEAFSSERVRSLTQGCMAHHYAEHAEDIESWLSEPAAPAVQHRRTAP